MKFTLSWLKEYVSSDYSPSEIAERLTMAGLEVDSFEERFKHLKNIVVSRVEHVEKHPGADNLKCCKVNIGGERLLSIVCGAPNAREGLVVPCAMIGAILPGDLEIKKSKMRGEISEGMLCSARELQLDTSHDGIMELDSNLRPGTPLADALNISDYLFEVDLTPNRPDCLSVIGLAREVAAFSNPAAELTLPYEAADDFLSKNSHSLGDKFQSIHDFASVAIADPDLCSRYSAGMVVDVKVAPSPFWLQERLISIGLTPINNIVDVTNFVMMETGQPLHAFDYDKIAGHRIEVKRAGSPIEFTTLDGKKHTLEPDMLMICDGERPVGIAGVMGGENSEILDTTERVLLESACFNHVSIRKTAKRSGINTDASHRFERGVDPQATKDILKRALHLIAEVSGGKVIKNLIDINPTPHIPIEISLDTDALNRRLGTGLSAHDIKKYLESVQFSVSECNGSDCNDKSNGNDSRTTFKVTVPPFRVDVTRSEDLSEEVARLWGYNNIKTSFPQVPAKGKPISPRILIREQIKDVMNGFGFSEAINYSFTSSDSIDRLSLHESDKRRQMELIINPISEDLSVLRTSLLPGLFENMRRNNSQQVDSLKLFEVGKVFIATKKGVQPEEKEFVAAIWTGLRSAVSWHMKPEPCDFYDIKGAAEGVCTSLGISNLRYSKPDSQSYPYLKKTHSALISSGEKAIGVVGQINSQILKNFNLRQDAFVFELDLEEILKIAVLPGSMSTTLALPKFPSLSRDITFILDSDIATGSIIEDIESLRKKEPIIEDVFIFDLYEGKPLAEGKKSLSIRVVYRSSEKTLSEKIINVVHSDISKQLMEKYKADLP